MYHRGFKQTITFWAVSSVNAYNKKTFSAPVAISGRWEEKAITFRDKHGKETVSKSIVYLASDIDLEGYLFNGTSIAADPTEVNGAWEIQQKSSIPDLRSMKTLYTAFL